MLSTKGPKCAELKFQLGEYLFIIGLIPILCKEFLNASRWYFVGPPPALRARLSPFHTKKALASKWYTPGAWGLRPVGRYKIWLREGLTLEEITFLVGHTIYTFASIPEMQSSQAVF